MMRRWLHNGMFGGFFYVFMSEGNKSTCSFFLSFITGYKSGFLL